VKILILHQRTEYETTTAPGRHGRHKRTLRRFSCLHRRPGIASSSIHYLMPFNVLLKQI